MPIMQVVDPAAMLVRVKVNQADVHILQVGQPARISLDAYPELQFQGRVEQVAPVGTTSMLTTRVRNFVGDCQHQGEPSEAACPTCRRLSTSSSSGRTTSSLCPATPSCAKTTRSRVRVLDGDGARPRTVTLGAMNDYEVIVASGLEPGMMVQRHVAQ